MSRTTDCPSQAVVNENQNRMAVSTKSRAIWMMVTNTTVEAIDFEMNSSTVSWIRYGRTGVRNASTMASTTDR